MKRDIVLATFWEPHGKALRAGIGHTGPQREKVSLSLIIHRAYCLWMYRRETKVTSWKPSKKGRKERIRKEGRQDGRKERRVESEHLDISELLKVRLRHQLAV